MNKNMFWAVLALLFLSLSFLGTGCAGQKVPEIPESKIHVVTLKGSTAISLIRMIDTDVQVEGASRTTYEIAGTPDLAVSKILSNEADIATIPTNVAARLFNNDVPYRIGAVTGWGVLYVLSSDDSIRGLEDLESKTVYTIARGSTPDILLRYLLDVQGLEADKDVKIDYSFEQIELTQVLIAQRTETAMLPEPFVTRALMQNPDLRVIADIQGEWEKLHGLPLPQTCIFISSEWIDNNPEIVDNFLKEAERSIQWANANIEEAADLAEKYEIGLDKASAVQSIPRSNIRFQDVRQSRESLEKYFEVINGFSPEDIGGKIPSEDFYYIQE